MQNDIPPLGEFDVFSDLDNWDDRTAGKWVDILNQRAASADQIALRSFILQQSAVKYGNKVLELGCGTGRLLADLSRATGSTGQVYGLEPQRLFASEAERFLRQQKLDANTRVFVGRAEDIHLPDESIDICIAQTVLIHIPADMIPKVFAQVRRVVKPGGSFVSVDQDGDTWTIDHPDRETTRKIVRFNSDHRYADGWTGRYLRRLFKQNGFSDVILSTWTHLDTEGGTYLHSMAQRVAEAAAEHDIISEEECRNWLDKLDRLTVEGNFFSSINFFCCQGRK